MRPKTVLSLEQALALPSATERFVHLGWRVLRVEATPVDGEERPGDPNRYVGDPVAGPDRCAYFFAANAGKESIAIDLKTAEGRELLCRLVRDLEVDVFCGNTLPRRYEQLGIDEPTLRQARPELIWVGLSAFGPERPDVPGYDPALQAMLGYMHLTGPRDGPPTLCGIPIVDLRAGEEVFSQVCLALAERAETGEGARIDISMAQAAASWLATFMPLHELGAPPESLRRAGNEHRVFVPVNVYNTRDGYLYLAVGNDVQWRRLVALPDFEGLAAERRAHNAGRQEDRRSVHRALGAILARSDTADLVETLTAAGIVAAPINDLEEVSRLELLRGRRPETRLPDDREIRLAPPAVDTAALAELGGKLPLPPRYGEHTDAVLEEVGVGAEQIAALRAQGIVAG